MGNQCHCTNICSEFNNIISLNEQVNSTKKYECHFPSKVIENSKETPDIQSDYRFIESYNSYTNFFYHLKKIIKIQQKYKAHFKLKRKQQSLIQISYVNNDQPSIKQELIVSNEDSNMLSITNKQLGDSILKFNKKSITSFYSYSLSMKAEDIPETHIRGYFLKKKRKYKFKGSKSYNKKEGFGIVTWDDNSTLYAKFINSRANGYCKYNDVSGTIFTGCYNDNKPKGYGTFYSGENARFEGYWLNSTQTGLGIEVWKDENYYQGDFEDSKKNGIGLYRWPDGAIYQGEWKNNQMNGLGIMKFADDSIYAGEFRNGLMNGFGEFIWFDQKKYIGCYENDKKHGFGVFVWTFKNLIAHIGFWHEGKAVGPGIKINGPHIIYGVWRDGQKPLKLAGFWELKNYMKGSKHKYLRFLEQNIKLIIKLIMKLQ